MAGDTVARSVPKFIYIRVGGQIRWIYPPLNKPKTLAVIFAGQMRLLILGLLTTILTSCGESDNFYDVSKIITAPDTVTINKEFDFKLILRNETDKRIKLTIDNQVTKSIQFLPDWRCDGDLLVDRVPNPTSSDNNYEIYHLDKGDSIVYELKGLLSNLGMDSLKFSVQSYDRVFKMKKPKCRQFVMSFNGMWLPGDFNPLDAMEGYNFGKEILIRE
jgi:hypothetical protein